MDGAVPGPVGPARPATAEEDLDETLEALSDLVSEDRPTKRPGEAKGGGAGATREADRLAFDALVDGHHYRQGDLPRLILQINVAARGGHFEGPDIMRAVQGVRMHAGEMDIFHRHDGVDGAGRVLYSMASMVNPGTFPLHAMEDFRTPGLTLFAQLPGSWDDLAVFSDMLSCAERLATELGGDLEDDSHSRLSKQTIEHIRSQITEHRRRVQLLRSRQKGGLSVGAPR
jgi:cell division protein ZipA